MFKAFKRDATLNSNNRTGLGLGLYISSEIMTAHGGGLSVQCHDGLTIFTAHIDDSKTNW
jgi:K+-sensing histidine kinase KdpD